MTISTTSSTATFLGNNATTVFTYAFVCDTATEFQLLLNNADGTSTTLSPTQYTLNINPPAAGSLHSVGGTVTYPKVGSPIANGVSLTASRIVPLTQTVQISNQGDFYPTVTESALDELCLEIQQVSARTGQFRGTWATGIAYNYGDYVQDGANGANTLNYYTCIIQNTAGVWATDLANGEWSLAINTAYIQGLANAAAASAATATTQAGNAATSAAAASASAGSAATSAGTATTQAGIATTQAGNASTSATSAAGSATTATTQATNASASAATASTGASTATTQAGIATTQATNASSSATAAAASAVLAGTALTATSTTNLLIGTGSKTFTTQANKNFFAGQFISAASNANALNYMHGQVTSYSGTTLTINVLDTGGSGTLADWNIAVSGTQGSAGGGGSVTSVSVTTANGVSGSVANPTSTPAITLTLGAITPTSVNSSGTVAGSNLSGTNTGDQTITLTGGVTGSGTGSFAATVVTNANLTGDVTSTGNATTLATVNSNVGSFTNANVTVNAKGLVTAAANGTSASSGGYRALSSTDTVTSADNNKLLTFSGACTLTLTAAATIGSFTCHVQNTATSGAAVITLTPSGADNLDGSNSTLIMLPGETRLITCNATAWFTEVIVPFTINTSSTVSLTLPRNGYVGMAGQLWGGGASGGAGATDGGGGGGGGAFNQFTVMSNAKYSLNSTALTLTVGAGGNSQTSANTAGNAGGTTSVQDTTNSRFFAFAYGGGAGGGSSLGAGGGGGGTGNSLGGAPNINGTPNASGAGTAAVTTTPGVGGADVITGNNGGSAGAGALASSGGGGGIAATKLGGWGYYGGGGGGCSVATTAGAGGQSIWGGGGGGGASNVTGGAGGISTHGGSGGAGGNNGAGTQGSAPGGGGGGAVGTVGSGAGAAGQIIIQGIA